jgi:hypothetical protein
MSSGSLFSLHILLSRYPEALNYASGPKQVTASGIAAKADLSSALTVAWKLSYAMKFGLLPIVGEISGLRTFAVENDRKRDVIDSQPLAQLLRHRLIGASLTALRDIRDLMRRRRQAMGAAASAKIVFRNRSKMPLSNLAGLSGCLGNVLAGQALELTHVNTDPEKLAQVDYRSLGKKNPAICQALVKG